MLAPSDGHISSTFMYKIENNAECHHLTLKSFLQSSPITDYSQSPTIFSIIHNKPHNKSKTALSIPKSPTPLLMAIATTSSPFHLPCPWPLHLLFPTGDPTQASHHLRPRPPPPRTTSFSSYHSSTFWVLCGEISWRWKLPAWLLLGRSQSCLGAPRSEKLRSLTFNVG